MKKIYVTLCLTLISLVINAQSFERKTNLNLNVTADTTIYPFDGNNVTGIGVSGNICFTSEMGFVRFVVSDDYDDEYLVYESYRLFEQDSIISFYQKCEESCFYYNYIPTKFKIYVNDAAVTINSIDMSSTLYSDAENRRIFAARETNDSKLLDVQNYISENGLIWVAKHTKMSDLSYSEKKKMLGDDFRTYGYEYYSSGVFSLFAPNSDDDYFKKTGHYVADFDWRNRHGANDPNSYYYDDDPDGTGWLSPLKCQDGCWKDGMLICSTRQECDEMGGEYRSVGSCWVFSATACVETMANLYYNKHLDLDLAEQYICCNEPESFDQGGQISKALDYYKNEGVPFESAWPYIASLDSCDVYPETTELVRIDGYNTLSIQDHNKLREELMNSGPIAVGFNRHAMSLIGWGTIDETTHDVLGYPEDDDMIYNFFGYSYWIFKDSFGQTSDFEDGRISGYVYTSYPDIFDSWSNYKYRISPEVLVPDMTEEDIQCNDEDGDGYYFWGIGSKPTHCPPCPDEPDGDDSNPSLGPINEYGQCTIINGCNFSFENGWDDWVQDKIGQISEDSNDWWRHTGPTSTSETGPTSAQDGDYYMYVDGSPFSNCNTPALIVSPPIDFSNYGDCGYIVDFYYHMKSPSDNAKLYVIQKKKDSTQSTIDILCDNDAGNAWQHCTLYVESDIEQIGFGGSISPGHVYPDIAIDNISIRPLTHNENPDIINSDIVWDKESFGTNKIIESDIIIENGAKLTITKGNVSNNNNITLKMLPDAKIIVKPGGKLILDGCTLDCACDNEMWQGIQVWGNNTKDQLLHDGSYYQGFVEIKNKSRIKNALCAVELWNPDNWSSTGGIIHARNSTFENNAKAIHAINYNNTLPNGNILNYNAIFTNCEFTINGNYKGVATFYKHVDLANVTGVRFHGCDFSIKTDDDNSGDDGPIRIDNVSYWSEGIAAYNAGFTVDGIYSYYHDGTTHVDKKSTFTGFHAGAYSVRDGAGGAKTFTIKDSEFSNNDFGVFAIDPNYATVIKSTFSVGHDNSRTCNAGIFLNNSRGFLIEENTFRKDNNAIEENNYGVIIKNSRDINELYRNTFEGLYCGNIAVGKNRNNISQDAFGLSYGCNDNIGNEIDFYVNSRVIDGIQRSQGSMTIPAGNTFSDNALYHFYNEGINVDYYYNSTTNGNIPDNDKVYRVSSHNTSAINDCLSNYDGVNIEVVPVLPPEKRQQVEQKFYESQNIYNNLKAVYDSRIDGGNTANTISEIQSTQPEDMWSLRSMLLGTSPYLSKDVLYAAADRNDILPSSVLFEILISNPDELKNDELIDYMANKSEPLPDYMIDIMQEVANGTSARTVLMSNMARYKHASKTAANIIIRSIMNDSVINKNDLVTWLGNIQDIGADLDIISIYIAEGNFDNAFALANMLPNLYNLEGDKLKDHSDYMQLLTLYRALAFDDRNTMQLSEGEKKIVDDIAYNGVGNSQSMAKSLLTIYGNFDEECPQISVMPNRGGNSKTTYNKDEISRAMGLSLKVTPSPADTWVTVEYTLPKGFNNAIITLTNSMGIDIYTQNVQSEHGQKVIEIQQIPVGIYILTIKCEEHSITEKLVITR